MNVLLKLKLATAAAQPAPAVPPPNKVSAPAITVNHTGSGGLPGRATPSIAASGPTGQSPNHAATPLTPAPAAPGQKVMHNGTLVSPEEQAMIQQQEAEAQAEALKNQPKTEKAPAPQKQDTVLSAQLVDRWSDRLSKIASDAGFMPVRNFEPVDYKAPYSQYSPVSETPGRAPNLGRYAPTETGGVHGGLPDFSPPVPFDSKAHPTLANFWRMGRQMLTRNLTNVQSASGIADRDLRGPTTPYQQSLARNLADPVQTGDGTNPLITLAANAFGSMMGGKKPDMQQVGDALGQAGQFLPQPSWPS